MARANETERNREKEKEEKGFKRKSQSGVQWYEAQREVTSEVVRGDCSRNPSDGKDHACLHARDNDAARRRLFLYSRSSLFLARPFFSFSSSIFFCVLFSLFLIFFYLPPRLHHHPRRPIPRGTVFQAVQRTAEWVGEL